MSDNCRELLRDVLAFVGALAVGLFAGWLVLKMQKPDHASPQWWLAPPAHQEQAAK